ncbi:hypothetical protein [Promicromonospora soli]
MSEFRILAGRMHAEFRGIVDLARDIERLGQEDSIEAFGKRWSFAIDVLSRTARVHNGARAVLGADNLTLVKFENSPFCFSWYRDFARLRNTECSMDDATFSPVTCDSCKEGVLPCRDSLTRSPHVRRGMYSCRAMRNRYEHYEGYFLGEGDDQRATKRQRSVSRPQHEPWVSESSIGDGSALEIRIDVYERGGLRAFVLDVESTVSELLPVIQEVGRDPRVFDEDHDEHCGYCRAT